MANILEPIKNTKNLKNLLTRTYYIAGHIKQPLGPRVGQPWCVVTIVTAL